MDKTAVADALERAADLYEAEEIGWCKFKWVEREVAQAMSGSPLGLPAGQYYRTGRMTMCAEGALLKAVGFTDEWIDNFGDGLLMGITPPGKDGLKTDCTALNRNYNLFHDAVCAVESRLPSSPSSEKEEPAGWSLAGWNDQRISDKVQLIELFKNVAKDLRNGEE